MNEIMEVQTSFADVAQLGQGYVDRVDGERMLLALGTEMAVGDVVRFIVHLVDGTPAFAGAGRCVQVSDQGPSVPASDRYETLLDTLTFDERSAPVYDYIVAVRQMTYNETAGEPAESDVLVGEEHAEQVPVGEETAVYGADLAVAVAAANYGAAEVVTVISDEPAGAARAAFEPAAEHEHEHEFEVDALPARGASDSQPTPHGEPLRSTVPTPLPAAPLRSVLPTPRRGLTPVPVPREAVPAHAPQPVFASVVPMALPTGILTRPAVAAHWVPSAVRPQPRAQRSSQFQQEPGPLQIPAAPPRPHLDRSRFVERAPAPARA